MHKKKSVHLVLAAMGMAAMLWMTAPAAATTVVGDEYYFGNYDFNSGGSFTAYSIGTPQPSFKTFCVQLEQNVYVNNGPGSAYRVSSMGYTNDTPDSPRTITPETAWLYTAFLNGSLSGYVNDTAHEAAVQYGIWRSMGYSDADISQYSPSFYTSPQGAKGLYDQLGWSNVPSTWSGMGDVQVAVIKDAYNNSWAQDILTTRVPEPATLTLLAVGAITLIRRFRA